MRTTLYAAALIITLAGCGPAAAAGAIAFGATGNVIQDGYSLGISAKLDSDDAARDAAMTLCRANGGKQSQSQCEVLVVFHKQCVAEAQDPKNGTPGFGFALGETEDSAKAVALAICSATAGKARRKSCEIINSRCD